MHGEHKQFEIRSQRGDLIACVEDWLKFAPPKRGLLQWKDFRSAKELARSFLRSGRPNPPVELLALLRGHFGENVQLERAIPERITRLDDLPGEHRNCDLVLHGQVLTDPLIVNIEAKADEPFGELTGEYYDRKAQATRNGEGERQIGSSSNVPKRIENLASTLFGRLDDRVRDLRYQLLHGTVATLISAEECGASIAVFLVYEFISAGLTPEKVARNRQDWAHFVRAFPETGAVEIAENQILGPIRVPNFTSRLYLGHLVSDLSQRRQD